MVRIVQPAVASGVERDGAQSLAASAPRISLPSGFEFADLRARPRSTELRPPWCVSLPEGATLTDELTEATFLTTAGVPYG
jgi:hypothetical protein